mgnify:FL=1
MQTAQQSSKQDILEYLLKHTQASALELADALEISVQAVRRHLKDLEGLELIVNSASVQTGTGRPQHIYKLSQQGRDSLRKEFVDSYGDFAVSLLDTLAQTVGHDQVSTILRLQWQRKAVEYHQKLGMAPLQDRVAMLVELRKAEGYMAEWHPVESNDSSDERFIIAEHNCAISNVAESFPSLCGHELEMFAAVLPDCTVERTHWIINGEHRCGYLVQSRKMK